MLNVIGLGYIGFRTAIMFAQAGYEVVGTDLNNLLINNLNRGELPYPEPGLYEMFQKAKKNGIVFSNEYIKSDYYIIAVPTPFVKENKQLNPSYVLRALEQVLDVCMKGSVIIIESTISPGTIDKYVRSIVQSRGFTPGVDIHLAHAPERIIPGSMLKELRKNDRTIGVDDVNVGNKIKELYTSFCEGEIIVCDIKTAEMSKVVENTFRDINIAFANELAKICHAAQLDVYEIIRIANRHPRVNILQPGPGVGGHCIPVDPWFLVGDYPHLSKLIAEARSVNDSMPAYVLDRAIEVMSKAGLHNFSRVGIYGIAYKENVDDIRESSGLQLLEVIKQRHLPPPVIFDPLIKPNTILGQVAVFEDFLESVDMVIVLTAHSHLQEAANLLREKVVLDTRNLAELSYAERI
jgi:UDP-N-acetyl-D-mannosaminuronic acid dehydrogenase